MAHPHQGAGLGCDLFPPTVHGRGATDRKDDNADDVGSDPAGLGFKEYTYDDPYQSAPAVKVDKTSNSGDEEKGGEESCAEQNPHADVSFGQFFRQGVVVQRNQGRQHSGRHEEEPRARRRY